MNPIPKDQVLAAYQRAPQPVRDTFNSEVTTNVILDMKAKYRLHVDVAGTFGQEVGYLLLGLRSPAEFFGNLMLSGTDEQTARGIIQEVNERIFLPLKRQMTEGARESPSIVTNAPAPTPSPVAPVQPIPPPALEYAPPQTLPGSPMPAPMPAVVAVQSPVPAPAVSSPIQAPSAMPTASDAPSTPFIQTSPSSVPATPLTKDYAADPYREPI
jgi:hypothetical protein